MRPPPIAGLQVKIYLFVSTCLSFSSSYIRCTVSATLLWCVQMVPCASLRCQPQKFFCFTRSRGFVNGEGRRCELFSTVSYIILEAHLTHPMTSITQLLLKTRMKRMMGCALMIGRFVFPDNFVKIPATHTFTQQNYAIYPFRSHHIIKLYPDTKAC